MTDRMQLILCCVSEQLFTISSWFLLWEKISEEEKAWSRRRGNERTGKERSKEDQLEERRREVNERGMKKKCFVTYEPMVDGSKGERKCSLQRDARTGGEAKWG